MGDNCMDCGANYDEAMALSLLLPKRHWLLIHPDDGGLLCANCMLRRASRLPGAINITGVITFSTDREDVYASLSGRAALAAIPAPPALLEEK